MDMFFQISRVVKNVQQEVTDLGFLKVIKLRCCCFSSDDASKDFAMEAEDFVVRYAARRFVPTNP